VTLRVICRACGHEQAVTVEARSAMSAGGYTPDSCTVCESDDLIALRELTTAELAEIEEAARARW
jgi:hypothetical protein